MATSTRELVADPDELPDLAAGRRFSGRWVVLVGLAIIGLVAIPFLLAGKGADRYVDLRSLRQIELSSWRVGSFHLSKIEVQETDQWPLDDAHAHIQRWGLATPLRERPSLYWNEVWGNEDAGPALWHATFRRMPMAIIVKIDNKRPMSSGARAQLDLRLIMASVLDPANPEHRAAYRLLDSKLSKEIRVFDPLDPPRGRVGYVPPVEGERVAREILDQILDSAHENREAAAASALQILLANAKAD